MTLSFVVPAYQASNTIAKALRTIFEPVRSLEGWNIEVLVVDDGSPDRQGLLSAINQFSQVHLLTHERNRGMCASRNTGIQASRGDIITILDADDELVPDWPLALMQILSRWPQDVNVCFSACQSLDGRPTVSEPEFEGLLTVDDLLNERHSGEYLPLFRGAYIRARGYTDLNLRKSCGIVSYVTFAQDGPFWVTPKVLRIYHDRRAGSVSSNWTSASKAQETARCYEVLFERFGELYRSKAPRVYRTKLLRYAIYQRLAGEEGAWETWKKAAHWCCLLGTVSTLLLLLIGRHLCARAVSCAKRIGLVRQYG